MSSKLIAFVALLCLTVGFPVGALGETLLFSDNFNTSTSSTNANFEIGSRTGGAYSSATWIQGGDTTQVLAMGDPSGNLRLGPVTGSTNRNNWVWLNQNLNSTSGDSAGGMEIIIRANPNVYTGKYAEWIALAIGADTPTATSNPQTTPLNQVTLFLRGGSATGLTSPCETLLFANGANASFTSTWSTAADGTTFHDFRYVITGVGDDDPFDGVGGLHVALYVDGGTTDMLNYTSTVAHANNYIGLVSSGRKVTATDTEHLKNGGLFDNITIKNQGEVPEPSTLALLAAGLVGLLAYAWRKQR